MLSSSSTRAVDQKIESIDTRASGLDARVLSLSAWSEQFERDVRAAFAGVDARSGKVDERLDRIAGKLDELIALGRRQLASGGRRQKR